MSSATTDPTITHRLDPEQFDTIVNGLVMLVTELRLANGPRSEPAPAPASCDHEPWTFYDPRLKRDVVAYLDPQNQVRHVPVADTDDVPAGWRRILLA